VQMCVPLASYKMIKLHVIIISSFCSSINVVQAMGYKVCYIFSTSFNLLGQAFPWCHVCGKADGRSVLCLKKSVLVVLQA
jgi:hypothetical protein